MINYSKQNITKKDISSVIRSLKEEFITTGPATELFEKNFKNKVRSKFAVSCSSGTAALQLALNSINIKKGDVVILPVINFIASLNILELLKAKIYFADTDPITGQMSPKNLLSCIKKYKIKNIKAVITMYNGGDPLNAKAFFKLKKKYKFFLLEDACHALGGKYYSLGNHYVGSCKYSDISTFSFHPAKTLTTCEGGMVTTNNFKLFKIMKTLKNHGMIRKRSVNNKHNWKYKIIMPGYNFRLSDVNCALGISQLKRLDKLVSSRRRIAKIYIENLKPLKDYLTLPKVKGSRSAFHLFIVNFNLKNLKINRDQIIQILYKNNISTQVHYIPVNSHPYYKKYSKIKLAGANDYFRSCLSLPLYPDLKKSQVNHICKKIKMIIAKYKKN